jgi:hypothetical protein
MMFSYLYILYITINMSNIIYSSITNELLINVNALLLYTTDMVFLRNYQVVIL